ncbi:MAG: [protein-PII] uridylyltransferase [Alphaproteobacteria bacterium]|nr:[protein-PII] uridylyltransferase [Alphaproteobacteria bacterium]MBV9692324.1 [protein-PII] uridylyltransferase [Alphaproteobacteria bacterium]
MDVKEREFGADALRRDLSALARAQADKTTLRAAALALIRTRFQAARGGIRAQVESGALSGLEAARRLSAVQDTLIQVLYDFATKHFYYAQNPTSAEHLAIVATGGYGRGELAPGSDIDVLFLHPARRNAWCESVIEFVLHMLWDLGLKVGHAARTLAECARLAKEDSTIQTALLEARLIAGDAALFAAMRAEFWKQAAGAGAAFVQAKLAERDARHRRQGESRYLVEPNIKEGKGGLRDLQTLYWIGKFLFRVENPRELVAHQLFSAAEFESFNRAEAFLWDVRVRLHDLSGRAEERLSFDVQPALAAAMGYRDSDPRRAVEAFMKAYFLVAKDVGDLTRIFCAALEEQNRKPKPSLSRLLPGFLKPRQGDEDFYVENARLNAREGAFARDPANLLRIFQLADEKDVDVHPAALRTITRSLERIDDALRADPQANRLFLAVLCSRRDPEKALRRMNEAGVLGRFVPEFGRIVALMQFNMYHHYTVDEHLIRAVGNLAAIERGERKGEHPLSTEIIKRVRSREVLYCALLLHDIAKGMAGDHSAEGERIAHRLCPRWGLSADDTATVAWLVRNHLVMSDTAQRRDLSDPKTVRDFVAAVQSPELLRLLLVLTVADIRAVGPGVWNGWKGQLLRELYYEAEAVIAGGGAKARATRIAEAKAALAERLADLPQATRELALSRHHDGYWLACEPAAHEAHARLLAGAETGAEAISLSAHSDDFRSVTELVIATPDHPGLFSQLTGAISASGGSIVDAKAFTTLDGVALDVFSVQDADGLPFGDAERIARLKRAIERTIAGELLPGAVLGRRTQPRTSAFQVRPRVHFDNEASVSATVVELEGLDRPGLLYEISRALFESKLSISSAIVSTYGERAVDVFYVRDGFGHKIIHPERLKAVEGRLLSALNVEPEPASPNPVRT